MMVWLFRFLGIQKLLGKVLLSAGLLVLVIWLGSIVYSITVGLWDKVAFSNGRVQELVVLNFARADSLRAAQDVNLMLSGQIGELQKTIKVVRDSALTDKQVMQKEFDRQMVMQQRNIKALNDLRKKDLVYISKLETGLRVDTLKLTFKRALFGPDKLVDSIYVFGF